MTQEALKLALEFLEDNQDLIEIWERPEYLAMYKAAIDKCKEALAQPEQEPVGDDWTPCMKLPVVVYVRKQRLGESHVSTREGITPVKPDDLIMRGVSGEEYPIGRAIFEQTYSLNPAPPQPEQEQDPVAWRNAAIRVGEDLCSGGPFGYYDMTADQWLTWALSVVTVHSFPPQRTWVGLFDEEIWQIATGCTIGGDLHADKFARAIESKLKEVNT